MKHNGWRKPTPGLVAAEKYAQAGEQRSVAKSQATTAVKRVASSIGLQSQELLLLDTFASLTQPQDWEEGRRPIVWASNSFLMEQTGMSLSSLRRHVRRLTELGLIWIKDSPNGKRYGYRDDHGVIVEAFGFDLAPIAARTEEFEALYEAVIKERKLCKSLRTTITVTRRVIRAMIDKARESCLRGPWRQLEHEYADLIDGLPNRQLASSDRLEIIVDFFADLKKRVEQAFEAAFVGSGESVVSVWTTESGADHASSDNELAPSGVINGTHIQTTNKLRSVNGNRFPSKAAPAAHSQLEFHPTVDDERQELDSVQWSTHGDRKRTSEVDISTVMAACPEFAKTSRRLLGYIKSWDDLHRAAKQLCSNCGISGDAWDLAQQKLGSWAAAASIAIIYDKYSKAEIVSPGGYLRGIVDKALRGELHLERSLYGRLKRLEA